MWWWWQMGGFRRVTVQILAHSADYTVRNGNIEAAWIILFYFLARYIWLSSIGLLSFWSAVQFLSVHIHEFASFGSGDLFWPFPSVWLARTPYIVAVCGLLEEQIVGRRGLGILKIYGPLITACCDFWLCSFRSVFTGFLQAIHSWICFFLAFCICNFKDC